MNVQNYLKIIIATAVLHNIAIDNREVEPPIDLAIQVPQHLPVPNILIHFNENYNNEHVRNQIVNNFFI